MAPLQRHSTQPLFCLPRLYNTNEDPIPPRISPVACAVDVKALDLQLLSSSLKRLSVSGQGLPARPSQAEDEFEDIPARIKNDVLVACSTPSWSQLLGYRSDGLSLSHTPTGSHTRTPRRRSTAPAYGSVFPVESWSYRKVPSPLRVPGSAGEEIENSIGRTHCGDESCYVCGDDHDGSTPWNEQPILTGSLLALSDEDNVAHSYLSMWCAKGFYQDWE
ncbi:hypothetical protein V5O48_013115 [Marasmius crinis-equi]|uniref:Uncharacterized protein n=1 Tax=Marasmius crinis-equi TaxID=585013 RepID=A0ABR3F0Z5_9AGAR